MIKILFYIDTLSGGGAEKVLRTLVNSMDHSRFDISVMTAFPEDAHALLAPRITYRSLYKHKNMITQFLLRLEAELGLTYRIHIRGDYDIEVAYLECAPTKIMAGSTNKKAVKLAWVHCDLEKKAADPQAFATKTKPWYQKFHKIVFVSQNARESFVGMYGSSFDTLVLHNVNDETEIISKSEAFCVPGDGRKTITAVGRLSYEKGFDRLIQAAFMLKNQGRCFRLRILGEGPARTELEKMIQELDLQDCVELLGFQDNPYPYIRATDVVVCSSRYEGFSTVVTEALILGKPVVTTPCSGMDELLGNGEYGLITEDSVEGLALGIGSLLEDPQMLDKYNNAAKIRGAAFSKKPVLDQTERFFRMLTEKQV